VSAGKVEVGAFRTYPEGYTPPDAAPSEYQPIPLNKIEDFGVHADMYYSLEVSIFKTSLDSQIIKLLWNKYWANTLSASPLLSNEGFVGGQLEDMGMPRYITAVLLEMQERWLSMSIQCACFI
jgi:COP9 signalosome complex subunit 5